MKVHIQKQLENINAKIAEREEKWKGVLYRNELEIQRFVLLHGLPIDNAIYYRVRNKFVFNWKDYDTKITKADFDTFMEHVNYSEFPKDFEFVFKE